MLEILSCSSCFYAARIKWTPPSSCIWFLTALLWPVLKMNRNITTWNMRTKAIWNTPYLRTHFINLNTTQCLFCIVQIPTKVENIVACKNGNIRINKQLQGSHSDWKNLEKWERHFPVREKSGNFEQTGKVRENHTKYWKTEEISGIINCYFSMIFKWTVYYLLKCIKFSVKKIKH